MYYMGFDWLASVVSYNLKKYPGEIDKNLVNDGSISWNGYDCYKITINIPKFSYINYTVGAGESLESISKKNFISEYMIQENNPKAPSGFKETIKAGTVLKIPSDYAKKTILYIDKKTMLPVGQFVSDDKGLFEQYEFHNLQVNPVIKEEEFSSSYKEYKF